MQPPTRPTAELIRTRLAQWDTLENYRLQEQSLALLFKKLCPANTEIEHILLKVTALNQFYSTNIYDTFSVSKHILDKRIDARLVKGDHLLVNDLAPVTISGKTRHLYSFASKYCNHHFPDAFPIYDYFVERMLLHYAGADGFYAFTKADLKTYPRFVQVISEFRTFYGLREFTLRQLDIFLWLVGKQCFPRAYPNNKIKAAVLA